MLKSSTRAAYPATKSAVGPSTGALVPALFLAVTTTLYIVNVAIVGVWRYVCPVAPEISEQRKTSRYTAATDR